MWATTWCVVWIALLTSGAFILNAMVIPAYQQWRLDPHVHGVNVASDCLGAISIDFCVHKNNI